MDSTHIYQYAKPTSASLKPSKSSEPIEDQDQDQDEDEV